MPWTARRSVIVLIAVTCALRICWAAGMELGNDEAYHYLYTVHPDWSYFDHPPMLMCVAWAGKILCGGWVHPLSMRLGFILLFASSTWVLFDWTRRWFGDWAAFYAALAFNLAAYYAVAAGVFVLPDGPFLFFALLTFQALCDALFESTAGQPTLRIERDRSGKDCVLAWAWVGLACAGALASKYHGVLLPLATLFYVIVTPRAWPVLRTPGPYLAALLGAGGLTPVLIWNAQHDWASFAFQGGRAMGTQFNPMGLAVMIFGPIGYLLPWIWIPAVIALAARLRRFRTLEGIERFLICLSLVPLVLFSCVSCVRPILPHWPLIGFVPLFPLVGIQWAANAASDPRLVRRWVVVMSTCLLAIVVLFFAQARFGVVDFPLRSDPAREISGWESVGRELEARAARQVKYIPVYGPLVRQRATRLLHAEPRSRRLLQSGRCARGFAYWSRPDDWLGMDGLLISVEEEPNLDVYRPYFRSVELVDSFSMTRGGKAFRPVKVYLCRDQWKPFPFTYEKAATGGASLQ